MKPLADLDKNPGFNSLVKKDEVTFVIFIATKNDKLKFVTTSSDGFIKLNEIDSKGQLVQQKSLFVC